MTRREVKIIERGVVLFEIRQRRKHKFYLKDESKFEIGT
jgi:hypothetical protein